MTVAQQIFDKSWPLGKNGAGELIPGAAVLQERNGLDEPITLAASFQLDTATGQFLPTSKDLPLEVRVRELERLIGALAADPDALSILGRLKALADRLGDAVATPAAYTVLARLAAVEKKLADLETLIQGGIQLKGSLEVVQTHSGVTVGAGATIFTPAFPVNSRDIGVLVLGNATGISVSVAAFWDVAGNTAGSAFQTMLIANKTLNNSRAVGDRVAALSDRMRWSITNHDVSERQYTLYLVKYY